MIVSARLRARILRRCVSTVVSNAIDCHDADSATKSQGAELPEVNCVLGNRPR